MHSTAIYPPLPRIGSLCIDAVFISFWLHLEIGPIIKQFDASHLHRFASCIHLLLVLVSRLHGWMNQPNLLGQNIELYDHSRFFFIETVLLPKRKKNGYRIFITLESLELLAIIMYSIACYWFARISQHSCLLLSVQTNDFHLYTVYAQRHHRQW